MEKDDELFYANDEFFHMAGYKDIDELFKFTKKSFRNLIREDEQQQIESSIWEQIDNGNENDYIPFHLRKADGSYLSVLDHGRIVESPQYGKVFYVLLPIFPVFQLFAQGCHEYSQRSNIIFPTAAPNLLRNVGVCQNLTHIF